MALISYREWLQKQQESSPQTLLVNGPYRTLSASPFSRSTPNPEVVKDMLDNLGDKPKKRRRKKKKKKGGPSKKD